MGVYWDNLFPSCTYAVEINLVANLVVYNPKNRLKASEVQLLLLEMLFLLIILIFRLLNTIIFIENMCVEFQAIYSTLFFKH